MHNRGFTLLEMMIALTLFAILSAVTIPVSIHLIAWQHLSNTTDLLTNRLRLAQSISQTKRESTMVVLSPFEPSYSIRTVSAIMGNYAFSKGVDYKDGYLQLNTGRIAYNSYGDAVVSGVIRLVSGKEEQDVELYMGGLCVRKGILP